LSKYFPEIKEIILFSLIPFLIEVVFILFCLDLKLLAPFNSLIFRNFTACFRQLFLDMHEMKIFYDGNNFLY